MFQVVLKSFKYDKRTDSLPGTDFDLIQPDSPLENYYVDE